MLFVEIMRILLIHKGAVPRMKLVILPVPWLTLCTYRKNELHLKQAGQELKKNREENRVVRLKNHLAGTKVLPR